MGVERDAGMVAQASRAVDQLFQPAARDDVDVRRSVQVARLIRIQAITRALHELRVICQTRGQVLRGRQISLAALLRQQPNPTGLQVQKLSRSEEHTSELQ